MRKRLTPAALVLAAVAVASVVLAVIVVGSPTTTTAASRTVAVGRGVVQSTVSGSGSLAPSKQAELHFATSGELEAVDVKAGEHVVTGQLLARIDDSAARVDLAQAEADLQSAQDAQEAAESAEEAESTTSTSTASTSTVSATAAAVPTGTPTPTPTATAAARPAPSTAAAGRRPLAARRRRSVKGSEGNTIKVRLGANAKVARTATASAKAIHPGDTVVVQGAAGSNGTVKATSVTATAGGVQSTGGGPPATP